MSVFLLQNQQRQFLDKDKEWVTGNDAKTFFFSPHYDVALNQLIEINSKDHSLRGAVISCELDSKGHPELPQRDSKFMESATEGCAEPARSE